MANGGEKRGRGRTAETTKLEPRNGERKARAGAVRN